MRVRVLLFASCRQVVGSPRLELQVPEGITVAGLLARLVEEHPALAGLADTVRAAVNAEYAPSTERLREGDEVALIPPVSGGGGRGHFRVVDRPLEPGEVHDLVRGDGDGAVVTFAGVVRDHTGSTPTSYLEYEAYTPMAERTMAQIAAEAGQRWELGDVAILHRVGRLDIGEISVLIGVSSAHRAEAFEACRHLIERLKEVVPIWKKEVGPGGEYWVEGPSAQAAR